MLSLISRFRSSYTPTAYISNLLVSRFFIDHRRSEPISAPSATDPANDHSQQKDRREALKLRYANDPEYRAKVLARQKATKKARYANDPEYREKRNIQLSARHANDPEYRTRTRAQNNAWRAARHASDPAYRETVLARTRAWTQAQDSAYHAARSARNSAMLTAQYKSDAKVRETRRAQVAASRAKLSLAERDKMNRQNVLNTKRKYHNDFLSRQRNNLRTLITRKLHKQELTWRTHEVESNANEVTHTCSGPKCGLEKDLKLWMKRKESDPPLYDCSKCFTSEWVPEKVLPIGYEHVVFGSGEKIEPRRV
ncbi:hypothetical protein KCU65_g5066, partial [Aureobasidium melanogenum]